MFTLANAPAVAAVAAIAAAADAIYLWSSNQF